MASKNKGARPKKHAKTTDLQRGSTETQIQTDVPSTAEEHTECQDCKSLVLEHDETVECDLCQSWFHKQCHKVSDLMYSILSSEETEHISWYCNYCMPGAKKIMTQLLVVTNKQTRTDEKVSELDKRQKATEDKLKELENKIENLNCTDCHDQRKNNAEVVTLSIQEMEMRKARENNLVLFNVPENNNASAADNRTTDITTIKTLCKDKLQIDNVEITDARRLGAKSENVDITRPLRISLADPKHKNTMLKNSKLLRQSTDDRTKIIYISPDLTSQQRELGRKSRMERNQKQESLMAAGDTQHIWIIRGDKLIKVKRRQVDTRPTLRSQTDH